MRSALVNALSFIGTGISSSELSLAWVPAKRCDCDASVDVEAEAAAAMLLAVGLPSDDVEAMAADCDEIIS